MNPEISIIVPVYNVEKYLKRCIDSILNQSFENFELILVDDGSTDNSGKIVDEYEGIDKRIRVIHKENGGQGSARNRGLDIAKGNYIGFVDSDDWIHRDMYKILYENITKYNAEISQINHYPSNNYMKDDYIKEYNVEVVDNVLKEFGNCTSFELLLYIFVWNKLYSANIWKEVRFPENKFAEDLRVIYKIYDKSNKIIKIGCKLYYYYMSDNSSTRGKFNIKKLEDIEAWEEMLQFFNDNYPNINISNLKSVFCGRLLRYYFWSNEYKDIQKELKRKFNANFRYILKNKKLNYKEKAVYISFRISPLLCEKCFKTKLNIYKS